MLCERCEKVEATVLDIPDPLAVLMGQVVMWNYCKPCYAEELKLATKMNVESKDVLAELKRQNTGR